MPNDSDVGSESGVESERSRLLHTWGPSALIVTVVLAVVAWVLTTEPLAVSGTARENIAGANSVSEMRLAPEVIPWAAAEAAGTTASIDWGARCDTTTGKLAMPTLAGPCFAPFTGDNGGATSVGVTATSIKVVAYQTNPNDTMAALVSGAAPGTTDRDANFRTQQRYIEILSTYFETYGRHVELVGFTGTGQITDPVSAAADAETIARDLEPFAVIGGPLLTNALADTLASRKVLCFNCTPGQPSSFYAKRSPYVWDTGIGPEQAGLLLNEFLGKQLNGRPAAHAGDPAMVAVPRVFGSLHITLGPDTQEIAAIQQADLATYGVSYATEVTFASPLDIAPQGREMITRLKEAGVTTVVYVGGAFSVISLTKIATEQGYFPEWVIGGTALVDTAVIPRLYDQRQWAHAFGLASIPVRRADGSNATIDLYTWFFVSAAPTGRQRGVAVHPGGHPDERHPAGRRRAHPGPRPRRPVPVTRRLGAGIHDLRRSWHLAQHRLHRRRRHGGGLVGPRRHRSRRAGWQRRRAVPLHRRGTAIPPPFDADRGAALVRSRPGGHRGGDGTAGDLPAAPLIVSSLTASSVTASSVARTSSTGAECSHQVAAAQMVNTHVMVTT